MTTALAPYHLPHAIENTIFGALGVADRVGRAIGRLLAHVARSAFISGAVSVVEGAVRRGDAVVTSNVTHIRTIAEAAGATLRIESI